jgi:hypothetical protein
MPARRHGQACHGLHRQAERSEQQQEAGEAGIHGGKLTPHRSAMQAVACPVILATDGIAALREEATDDAPAEWARRANNAGKAGPDIQLALIDSHLSL